MRYVFVIIVCAVSLMANPVYAGQNEYDDCLLTYLINAKLNLAAQLIEMACRENYKDFTILTDKRKKYNECLLAYLPGMESSEAVLQIEKVCGRKHL